MGATTLLLIIACVNLANLMMARGARRRREFAVRAALGASRGRIASQLLTESVLLAFVSALIALPLAWYGIRWVHDAVPATDPLGPYYVDWSLDARTLLYAAATALVTGFTFGLVPAFDTAGRRLLNPLRENTGAAGGRLQRRVHHALIVAQLALALILLAGASLFVRTYVGLRGVELGYDMSHLMTMRFYLAGARYDAVEPRTRTVDEIARRLETLPGAHAATVTDLVPLDDQGGSDAPAVVEGRVFEAGREPTVHYAGVAGQWVETFNLRLLAGRSFYDHEIHAAAPVALVNAELARTFWPGQSAPGRRFRIADEETNPWLTVIGVVPDIRTVKLDESRQTPPTAYLPHRLISTRNYGIVIRSARPPGIGDRGRACGSARGRFVGGAVRCLPDGAGALAELLDVRHVGHDVQRARHDRGVRRGRRGVWSRVLYRIAAHPRDRHPRSTRCQARQIIGPMLRQVGGCRRRPHRAGSVRSR